MRQTNLESLKSIYQKSSKEALSEFLKFLSIQSVSAEEEYKPEVERCALWLKAYIEDIGLNCEIWPTSGHPVIFAEWNLAGPDKPTLLIYNHYDVQPVAPLEEWLSPPFEPAVREGNVYARGAQDNKGQCFYVLQALKLLFEKDGALPLNIKLCIEGEEECGSHGLSEILTAHKDQLKANYLAIVDLGIKGPSQPSLTLGIRGIIAMDVEVVGSHADLHSGQHGGIAYNPIHALVETLAKLRDANGKVTVPGFYDDVAELSPGERKQLALDFDAIDYERLHGVIPAGGEKSFSPLERNWLRPTLEINGIYGGYSGTGFKTVIPAKAGAKVSCRLVANQDPQEIGKRVAAFIEKSAPEGVQLKVKVHTGGGKAVSAQASSTVAKAFAKAFEEVFQKSCEFIYAGGSIPIVTELALACGGQTVLVGVGLDTDQIHAPNEHFGIDRLEKGALVMARAIEQLGAIPSEKFIQEENRNL